MHDLNSGPKHRSPTSDKDLPIAIDLGGTIEDSWRSKRHWFASKGFDLGPWPRSRGEVIQILGDRSGLYEEMVAEVYNDQNVLRRRPVKGVTAALKTLSQQFKILIVSSRCQRQRATTWEWLDRYHLSTFVSDVALLGTDTNKLVWCLNAGVLFVVDDDPRHLEPDISPQLTRIRFSARPGTTHRTPAGVIVAATWQDIVTIVTAPRSASVRIPNGDRAEQ